MKPGTSTPRNHILIDRCLSPELTKPLGRLYQLRAVTLADIFGRDYSQTMPDVEWIEYCGRNNVVALTANPEIRKVEAEMRAIETFNARVLTQKAAAARLESAMILGQNMRTLRVALATRKSMFVKITSGSPTWWIRPE